MRTFGRLLAGLGTAVIGSVGAVAMLPPPVLDNAGSYVEEHRQALPQHPHGLPGPQELIASPPDAQCVPDGLADASRAIADCAALDPPPGDPATLLSRSNEAARRFRAPPPQAVQQ